MIGLLCFVVAVLASAFKSKIRLEAENAALRHQVIVLRRKLRGRVRLTNHDRWFFVQLYRWFPSILTVITIVQPETLVAHLRRILTSYARYYNETRTHLALDKDTPVSRPGQRTGAVRSLAILGGLHHRYARA